MKKNLKRYLLYIPLEAVYFLAVVYLLTSVSFSTFVLACTTEEQRQAIEQDLITGPITYPFLFPARLYIQHHDILSPYHGVRKVIRSYARLYLQHHDILSNDKLPVKTGDKPARLYLQHHYILSKEEFREAVEKVPRSEIYKEKVQAHMNAKFSEEELNFAREHFEDAFMAYCLQRVVALFTGDRAGRFVYNIALDGVPENRLKGIFKEYEFTTLFEQCLVKGIRKGFADFLEQTQ